jgi:hypothetical protein
MGKKDAEQWAQDLATKAALSAGRTAAKAAIEDVWATDAEKAARAEARERTTKTRLVVAVVVATMGAVLVIAIFQFLAQLWLCAIGGVIVAGVVGVAALLLRPRFEALRTRLAARRASQAAERAVLDAQQRERQQLAAAHEARTLAAQKIDDDLARLKQQAGR